MKIEINIDCEDEGELLSHLSVIRTEVKRAIRKKDGYINVPVTIEDENCYGTHTVNIIPECTEDSGHFPDGNGFCLSCGDQLGVKIEVH